MTPETRSVKGKPYKSTALPSHVQHKSFSRKSAAAEFDPTKLIADHVNYDSAFMPDEVTKQHAKCMHYAAHRLHAAATPVEHRKWMANYLALRDRIVLGNRKLVYRAVSRHRAADSHTDDLMGDCHIVLIQAVAAFNPWIGIRFSTYAFTCLLRALARRGRKMGHDPLARAVALEGEPIGPLAASTANEIPLELYLREDHPLLTEREKTILSRRFRFEVIRGEPTLETVGRSMGLSKERVRQVQSLALDKLRQALSPETASC